MLPGRQDGILAGDSRAFEWTPVRAGRRNMEMDLIQMSVTAGILIVGITAFRFLFNHRISRRVVVLLWEIAILRLMFPFWIPLPFPGIGDLAITTVEEEKTEVVQVAVSDQGQDMAGWKILLGESGERAQESCYVSEENFAGRGEGAGRLLRALYGVAALAMTAGSVYLYFRDSQQFREGLPMSEREKALLLGMLEEEERERLGRVRFCISDRTATPVTWGIFRPAIVFPKGICRNTEQEIAFWLRHELVHIRHHDNLKKIVAHGALCLHWFNPLVWVMYLLFNRDMEILCDETVVRRREGSRRDYALALLSMAEKRSLGFQTGMGFGKSAVTERITAVMKMKKMSGAGFFAAGLAVTAAFTALGAHSVSFAAGSSASRWGVSGERGGEEYWVTVTEDVTEEPAAGPGESAYALQEQTHDVVEERSGVAFWADVSAEGAAASQAEATVTEDSMVVAKDQDSAANMSQETTSDPVYLTAVAASESTYTPEVEGQTERETQIADIIEEYREFGISITVSGDDYQLYFEGEPIYFFADNRIPEEEGFSGRLFLRPAGRGNGRVGVVTVYGRDGELSGVRLLSREESRAYTSRWQ